MRALPNAHGYGGSLGGFDFRRRRMVAHQDVVSPTMVVALEFKEFAPLGGRPGQTKRQLHDLSSAVGEANEIGTGDHTGDYLRSLKFQIVLGSECETATELCRNGFDDLLRRMPKN